MKLVHVAIVAVEKQQCIPFLLLCYALLSRTCSWRSMSTAERKTYIRLHWSARCVSPILTKFAFVKDFHTRFSYKTSNQTTIFMQDFHTRFSYMTWNKTSRFSYRIFIQDLKSNFATIHRVGDALIAVNESKWYCLWVVRFHKLNIHVLAFTTPAIESGRSVFKTLATYSQSTENYIY